MLKLNEKKRTSLRGEAGGRGQFLGSVRREATAPRVEVENRIGGGGRSVAAKSRKGSDQRRETQKGPRE